MPSEAKNDKCPKCGDYLDGCDYNGCKVPTPAPSERKFDVEMPGKFRLYDATSSSPEDGCCDVFAVADLRTQYQDLVDGLRSQIKQLEEMYSDANPERNKWRMVCQELRVDPKTSPAATVIDKVKQLEELVREMPWPPCSPEIMNRKNVYCFSCETFLHGGGHPDPDCPVAAFEALRNEIKERV